MASEIKILTWCDLEHAQQQPAATWTVSIAGPGETPTPHEVDLCDACAASYLDLRAEVVEHGRPVSSKSSSKRAPVATGAVHPTTACPAPGCDYTTTTATGLTAHARNAHNSTLSELTGEASIPCPVDGCGRKFGGRQGVISHVRSMHPGHDASSVQAS